MQEKTENLEKASNNRKIWALMLTLSVTIIGVAFIYTPIMLDSRAVLVSPRFGAPIRTEASLGIAGTGKEISAVDIIIAIEPSEAFIQSGWLKIDNWEIGLSTS